MVHSAFHIYTNLSKFYCILGDISIKTLLNLVCQWIMDSETIFSWFYMTCLMSVVVSTNAVFGESSLVTPKWGLVLKVNMVMDVLRLDVIRLSSPSLQVMLRKRARRNLKSWKMLNKAQWLIKPHSPLLRIWWCCWMSWSRAGSCSAGRGFQPRLASNEPHRNEASK